MLKELRLINWKSFARTQIYFDRLTLLIGTNASGKSNLLEALMFLQRIMTPGITLSQSVTGVGQLAPIRGGISKLCREGQTSFTLTALVEAEVNYVYEIKVEVEDTAIEIVHERVSKYGEDVIVYEANRNLASGSVEATFKLSDSSGQPEKTLLPSYQSNLRSALALTSNSTVKTALTAIIECLEKIFVYDPIPNHMRLASPPSEVLAADASNIAGMLIVYKEKERVEEQLLHYLSGIPERDLERIWVESVGLLKENAEIYCQEGWKDKGGLISAQSMSDGTLRFIAIAVALLTMPSGTLLVIDEIDSALHPSRMTDLLKMIAEVSSARNIDVLATTHNPSLLDNAGPGIVPFITVAYRRDNGDSEFALLEDNLDLPRILSSGRVGTVLASKALELSFKQGGQR